MFDDHRRSTARRDDGVPPPHTAQVIFVQFQTSWTRTRVQDSPSARHTARVFATSHAAQLHFRSRVVDHGRTESSPSLRVAGLLQFWPTSGWSGAVHRPQGEKLDPREHSSVIFRTNSLAPRRSSTGFPFTAPGFWRAGGHRPPQRLRPQAAPGAQQGSTR